MDGDATVQQRRHTPARLRGGPRAAVLVSRATVHTVGLLGRVTAKECRGGTRGSGGSRRAAASYGCGGGGF